jgi:hypothetical protein
MQICDSIIQAKTAVVPAKRAAVSARRDPVTPMVLMLMDRGYWISAYRLRAPRFGGLEPAEARKASVGWVAGMSGCWSNVSKPRSALVLRSARRARLEGRGRPILRDARLTAGSSG